MIRLSKSEVIAYNCLFQIHLKTMEISFKFPSVYFFQCKTIDNKILSTSTKRPRMQNGTVNFDEVIKFQTTMIFNKTNKSYLKKDVYLIVNLISDSRQDQVKLVGKSTINLTNLMQKNQQSTLRKGKNEQNKNRKKETTLNENQTDQYKKLDLCSFKGAIKYNIKLYKIQEANNNLQSISKNQFNQNILFYQQQQKKNSKFQIQKLQIDKFPSQVVFQPVKSPSKKETFNLPLKKQDTIQYSRKDSVLNQKQESVIKIKQLQNEIKKSRTQQQEMIKMMENLQQRNRELEQQLSEKEIYLKENLEKLQELDQIKYELMELREQAVIYQNQKNNNQKQNFSVFESRFRESVNYRDSIKDDSRQRNINSSSLRQSQVQLTSSQLRLCDSSTVRMQKQLSFMDIQLAEIRMELDLIKQKYQNQVHMHMETKQEWFKTQQNLQQVSNQNEESLKVIQQLSHQLLQKKCQFVQQINRQKCRIKQLKQKQNELKQQLNRTNKEFEQFKISKQIEQQRDLQQLVLKYEQIYQMHKDSIVKCKKLQKQNYLLLQKQKENQYNHGVKLWQLQNQVFYLNQKLQNSSNIINKYQEIINDLNSKINQQHDQLFRENDTIKTLKKEIALKSSQLQTFIQKENILKQYLGNLQQEMSEIYKIVNDKQKNQELLNNQLTQKEKQLQKFREEILYFQNYIQGLQAKCITFQKQTKLLYLKNNQLPNVNSKITDGAFKPKVKNQKILKNNIVQQGSDWNNSIQSQDLQKKLAQSYRAQQQLIKKNKALIQLVNTNTQKVIYSEKNKKQIAKLNKQLEKDKELRKNLEDKNNQIRKLNEILQRYKQEKTSLKEELTILKLKKQQNEKNINQPNPKNNQQLQKQKKGQNQIKNLNFQLQEKLKKLQKQSMQSNKKNNELSIQLEKISSELKNMEKQNKKLSSSLKQYKTSLIQTQSSLISKQTALEKLQIKLKRFQFSELSKKSNNVQNQKVFDSRSYSMMQVSNKDQDQLKQFNQNVQNLRNLIGKLQNSREEYHQNFAILCDNSQQLYQLSQIKLVQKQIVLQLSQGLSMQLQKFKTKILKQYKTLNQKSNFLIMFKPIEQNLKALVNLTQNIQELKLSSRSQCLE